MIDALDAPSPKKKVLAIFAFIFSLLGFLVLIWFVSSMFQLITITSPAQFLLIGPHWFSTGLLFTFGILMAYGPYAGIVLSIISFVKLRQNPELYGGKALTIVSLILSGIYVLVMVAFAIILYRTLTW